MNPDQQLSIIRSILSHTGGRDPTTVIHEISLITPGATLAVIHNLRT